MFLEEAQLAVGITSDSIYMYVDTPSQASRDLHQPPSISLQDLSM